MLLAYMRGLLKPDYVHGIRSVARENMILNAIEVEVGTSELLNDIDLRKHVLPLVKASSRNDEINDIQRAMSVVSRYSKFHSNPEHDRSSSRSVDSMVALYKALFGDND